MRKINAVCLFAFGAEAADGEIYVSVNEVDLQGNAIDGIYRVARKN